jgi:hypothetical protein
MVVITVQKLMAASHGGTYENLEALANEVKLASLDGTRDVTMTEVQSIPYEQNELEWPALFFEVTATWPGGAEPHRQIFFLLQDEKRGQMYNVNFTTPVSLFDVYESEAGRIIESFDFSKDRKIFKW